MKQPSKCALVSATGRCDWVKARLNFSCGMGKREGVGQLGSDPRPRGLFEAAHACSDKQQIVKAFLSYARLMSGDNTDSDFHRAVSAGSQKKKKQRRTSFFFPFFPSVKVTVGCVARCILLIFTSERLLTVQNDRFTTV